MYPSGSGPAYVAPGSLTLQFGVTRQNESQRRVRQVSATRPASSTTWSLPDWLRGQLVARPACPPPTIATSTAAFISAASLVRRSAATPGEPKVSAGVEDAGYSTRSPSAGSTFTPRDSR